MAPTAFARALPGLAAVPGRVLSWLLLVAVAFATRPLMPVDETRYVSVAWEMWQRGSFLVPYLNGVPYSHKPPLLFWLIQLGWWLFGVNSWWPRLLPSLFALANLALTASLASRLFGPARGERELAPLVLSGFFLWTFFTTTLTFDMMVAFFTLVVMAGLWQATHGRAAAGFALVAVGLGLGILAKGPVLLLLTLPALLSAPWWLSRAPEGGWGRYWLGALAALLGAVVIALAWAWPAGQAGGEVYRRAIFLSQTTDRLVSAEAHRQPFWFYLAILPAALFPFFFWPRFWRGLAALDRRDSGVRLALVWALVPLLLFTLISSKQPHYLLPLLPAVALLAARTFSAEPREGPLADVAAPFVVLAGLGVVLAILPWAGAIGLPGASRLPSWLGEMGPGVGLALLVLAAVGHGYRRVRLPLVPIAASLSPILFVALHFGVIAIATPAYDVEPLARSLSSFEQQGRVVGHLGPYHNQFHFAGRLRRPFEVVESREGAAWLASHPDGVLVGYYQGEPPAELGRPDLVQPFRNRLAGVWLGSEVRSKLP
ncbi:MAG: glycosyltransferase family 39 protein [Thermoanaerobaculia bacterium]